MSRKERIVRYTDKELENMRMHGQDKSDWKSAAAMSDKEIEAAVAEDDDEAGMHIDWSNISVEPPRPKAVLNMRIDYEVLEFFRSQGKGYQKKINAVLRSYVEQKQRH
ncbi:BrnA antitoxin family protein [Chlorobium sp.]|uniref:BrnA antitoxin family protein n=1 Tax=Chlorobium sp. TaxID=1095 RepID=UPI003C32FD99